MKIKATEIFDWNYNSTGETVINIGGARSSKSYSIAQLFTIKLLNESNKKFLILRKTLPSLKISTYKLFVDILSELSLYNPSSHNKTSRIYTHKTNYVHFTGLDDPQKIKSTEWNYIWMEEANEFTWEDFITLKTRMSASANDDKPNQLFMSLNPCDEQSWIRQKLELSADERNKIQVFYSSYKNNPFLTEEYVSLLESLKDEDETFYKIYALGEWVMPENLIYTNWEVTEFNCYNYDEILYGLDFGFNNPTSLVEVKIKDCKYFIRQLIYESKLTNADLIHKMKELKINSSDCIYADSAEAQRIEEISKAGFNIYPAVKSVRDGIDFVKRHKLSIYSSSTDIINEIKQYKWRQDKNGRVLDEPVKFLDHSMDAIRYALYTHQKSNHQLKIAFL